MDEPDPRHAELIVKSFNLENAKEVTTPSVKKVGEVLADVPAVGRIADTPISQHRDEGSVFVARQTDLSFSAKELA